MTWDHGGKTRQQRGYLGEHRDVSWGDATDETQAAVLSAMKADWERNHARVMAAWDGRDEHALYIAKEYHGDPAEPWALTEFGDPAAKGQ